MPDIEPSASRKPVVLLTCAYDDETMRAMNSAYEVRQVSDTGSLDGQSKSVRAIATRGDIGADRALIESLPSLEIIACYGVGFDAIDLSAARERGIRVTNTPDVLTGDVADLGIGLALATMRQIPSADAHVRSERWGRREPMPLVRRFYGCKLGIVGFGRVGKAVAQRATGFDTEIGYFDIAQVADSPHRFFADVSELAAWADVLIVTLAGGPSTHKLIGRKVLEALGPNGFLVNISRGSTIDEGELLDALESGTIAGAGLDVFLNEPQIDARFLQLGNVVLQPHHASATLETRRAMGQLMCGNLSAHFNGEPLLTPVV